MTSTVTPASRDARYLPSEASLDRPSVLDAMTHAPHRNWAGNHTYAAASLHHPETVAEVQALVARHDRVKVLGTRHSFNAVADTTGALLSLARLPREIVIDDARRTVTVDGGATYGQIGEALHRTGWALPNLASLPHISVAGACATATHGSGDRNGVLATAVSAMEVVTGTGDVVMLSRERHGDRFDGMVVSLGALGVVTRLTLDVEPAFAVRQDVYDGLPLERLEEGFDALAASGYSVSLFTRWRDARIDQLWLKRRVTDVPNEELADLLGAPRATVARHPIAGISAEHCTEQLGVAGPWYERLPHFRLAFTPSSGEELQTDYLVPRTHAWAALRAIHALGGRIAPLLQISEIRTVAADELWMSPCYRQPCVSLHFTWVPDWPAVRTLLPDIEAALEPLGARPHWGKLFTMAPDRVRSLYPRLPEFRALLHEYDPSGRFRNAFLDTYVT